MTRLNRTRVCGVLTVLVIDLVKENTVARSVSEMPTATPLTSVSQTLILILIMIMKLTHVNLNTATSKCEAVTRLRQSHVYGVWIVLVIAPVKVNTVARSAQEMQTVTLHRSVSQNLTLVLEVSYMTIS